MKNKRFADIEAVIFDLDGVLIDSSRAWHRVISAGQQALGYQPKPFAFFMETFGQGVEADRQTYFPRHTVQQVTELYDRSFIDYLDEVQVMKGATAVLRTLLATGRKRAVVTNTPRRLAERILEAKHLLPLIDTVCAAGDAPEKPAPDLIHLALTRLHSSVEHVVYVGDSKSDRAATEAAEVPMVGVGIAGEAQIGELSQLLPLLGIG